MKKPRRVSGEELALWQQAMRDVAQRDRVAAPPAAPELPREEPPPLPRHRVASPVAAKKLPELLPGRPVGIDHRTAQRLKRGQIEVEARLDLHGMIQDEAHRALDEFVVRAQGAGKRAVLIITGKGLRGEGTGVLRAAVPRWLNEVKLRALILSIAPAAPKDGGGGALYVLLKRQR